MRTRLRVAALLVMAGFFVNCGRSGSNLGAVPVDRPAARVQAQATGATPLRAGWNGVAFPGPLTSLNVPAGVAGLAHWNGSFYDLGPLTVAQVNAGEGVARGFWVFSNGAANVTYQTDDTRVISSVSLLSGWNQVAFPAPSSIPGSQLEARRNGSVVPVASVVLPQFSEIQEDRTYRSVDVSGAGVLNPGKAYWVFASVNATLSWASSTGIVTGQASPNVTVSLPGTNLTTTADPQGRFTLASLPPGPRTLRIGTQSRPVTVVAGGTVRLGGERLTRQQALDLVRARLGASGSDGRVILASQNLLPTGTVIREQSIELDDGRSLVDRSPLTCAAPSWLFYADIRPLADFDHDVQHILVDDATGQVQVASKRRWPAINDYPLWSTHAEWSKPDALAVEVPGASPAPVPTATEVARGVTVSAGPKRYAIYVAMNHERMPAVALVNSSFQPDDSRTIDARALVVPGVEPEKDNEVTPKQLGAAFEKAYGDACEALLPVIQPGDLLFVYVVGHGASSDAVGKPFFSTRAVVLETPQYSLKKAPGATLGDRLTKPLGNLQACKLVFLIDACYSGGMVHPEGFVDPDDSIANVAGLFPPQIEANLPKKTDVLVLTSADNRRESESTGMFGGPPPRTPPEVTIFGLELFDPARFVSVDADGKNPITLANVTVQPPLTSVRTYDDFKLSYSFLTTFPLKRSVRYGSQMYERKGDGTCKCLGLAPGRLRFQHTIRVTPLPQSVGTFAVTNNDSQAELIRASTTAPYLRVSPANATVAAGATANFSVTFTGSGVTGPGSLSAVVRFDCPTDFVEGLVDGEISDSVVLKTK